MGWSLPYHTIHRFQTVRSCVHLAEKKKRIEPNATQRIWSSSSALPASRTVAQQCARRPPRDLRLPSVARASAPQTSRRRRAREVTAVFEVVIGTPNRPVVAARGHTIASLPPTAVAAPPPPPSTVPANQLHGLPLFIGSATLVAVVPAKLLVGCSTRWQPAVILGRQRLPLPLAAG